MRGQGRGIHLLRACTLAVLGGVLASVVLAWVHGQRLFTIPYADIQAERGYFDETNSFERPIRIPLSSFELSIHLTDVDQDPSPAFSALSLPFRRLIRHRVQQALVPVADMAAALDVEVQPWSTESSLDVELPDWLQFGGFERSDTGEVQVLVLVHAGKLINYTRGIGTYRLGTVRYYDCRSMVDTLLPLHSDVSLSSGRLHWQPDSDNSTGISEPEWWDPLREAVNRFLVSLNPGVIELPNRTLELTDECWEAAVPMVSEWGLMPWPDQEPSWWNATWWYQGPEWWCPGGGQGLGCLSPDYEPPPFWDLCLGVFYVPPGVRQDWPELGPWLLPTSDVPFPSSDDFHSLNVTFAWDDIVVGSVEEDMDLWTMVACLGQKYTWLFGWGWFWGWYLAAMVFSMAALLPVGKRGSRRCWSTWRVFTSILWMALWSLFVALFTWAFSETSTDKHLMQECCGEFGDTDPGGDGSTNSFMFKFFITCTKCTENGQELTVALRWLDDWGVWLTAHLIALFTMPLIPVLLLSQSCWLPSRDQDQNKRSSEPEGGASFATYMSSLPPPEVDELDTEFSNTPYGRIAAEDE